MENLEYKIEEQRQEKDKFFGGSPRSPIPENERREFNGLNYFPVDSDLRFKLELKKHDDKKEITVEDTKGGEQKFIRWGEFNFEINGEEQTLHAFKGNPEEKRFWVAFKDETNGEETYGAGRYLDLVPSEHKKDGKWILDFNQAYNPSCAYNEDYVCPMIPSDNWLEVEIKAGEKKYHE